MQLASSSAGSASFCAHEPLLGIVLGCRKKLIDAQSVTWLETKHRVCVLMILPGVQSGCCAGNPCPLQNGCTICLSVCLSA